MRIKKIKRSRIIKCVLVFCLFCFANISQAAPSISAVNGTISHGNSVMISGIEFGSKSAAAPCVWDKCEGTWPGLSNGDAIPNGTSPWTGSTRSMISFYNTVELEQRSSLSTACYSNTNSCYLFVGGYTFESNPSQIYVSWWIKTSITSPESANKFLRLGEGDQGTTHLTNNTSSWCGQSTYLFAGGSYCKPTPGGDNANWDGTVLSSGSWHFMECYWDVTNRTWEYRVDGAPVSSVPISYAYEGYEPNHIWVVGLDTNLQDVGIDWWHPDSWMDDIYVDNTFQHVVIGNAPTYSTCNHLEVQPATAWNSNGQSITISLNQGSFPDGSTAYLYVVDSDGTANETGYPITFGNSVSEDAIAPAVPSGLAVN